MRTSLMLTAAVLALSACSSQAPAPEASEAPADSVATAPAEAMPSAEPSPAASETVAPEPSASPSASATPSPAPSASAKPSPTASATPVAAAAAPPVTFARCAICHNADKGAPDKIGPNLWGVYASKAGQGSFAYSEPLKNSGLTWTDANLDKWITAPAALVPGTKMAFPGIKDPAKRTELIAWLKTRR